jgi:hypothetical protein
VELQAAEDSVDPFQEKCRNIFEEEDLSLFEVYNANEMGLFWKAVPENTQANKKDSQYLLGTQTKNA